jgi:hypothetical protein
MVERAIGAPSTDDDRLAGRPAGAGSERLDTIAVLAGHVQVIARQTAQGDQPEAHPLAAITTALRDRADDFPALAAAMSAESDAGRDQAFDFGLDRIMDGLQVLMDSRRQAWPPSPEQPGAEQA